MKLLYSILAALLAFSASANAVTYDVTMRLRVPRVYDNSNSLGYRKYQTQKLVGTLTVSEGGEASMSLVNKTHKVNGVRVSYLCFADSAEWHLVGNNRTGKFNKTSVNLHLEALPSYVPTYSPTDDETLVLTLAGSGRGNRVSGYAAGTLGCGCAWYGHTSPTRDYFTFEVVDKAAVWGKFTLKKRK